MQLTHLIGARKMCIFLFSRFLGIPRYLKTGMSLRSSSRIIAKRRAFIVGKADLNIHLTLQVALWNQKLSEELGCPVIWDYHVVAVLRSRNISTSVQSWVYDFDTRLGIPVTFDSKLKGAT